MDEPIKSSMLDGTDFVGRLDSIEVRLAEHARRETPKGLTEPDRDAEEQWEAAQVWAHMAEFVAYWQEQIEAVVGTYDGEPVPFGRVKSDAGRIAAIEIGRREPITELARRVGEGIAELRRYLAGLTVPEWAAWGRHQTRGDMDLEAIVDEFVVRHLEEHLEQLDRLAAEAG